jgi:RNA polymerase sigma-B factor
MRPDLELPDPEHFHSNASAWSVFTTSSMGAIMPISNTLPAFAESACDAINADATLAPSPTPGGSPSRDGFVDVTDMFRVLSELDPDSLAFRRQRDAIFRRCLPLADNIARRFRERGEAHEDLVQAARVGLVNSVNRFDVSSGSEFIAFAVPTMMGEVRRHFRDHGWSLKVPRRLKELNLTLKSANAVLAQRLNRAPTASELATYLDLDREEVVEGLIAANAYSTRSSDIPIGSAADGDTIADKYGDLDANLERVLDVQSVRPLLDALPYREREILNLRFFQDLTQSQIAERTGVSQMHVSRLLARALSTMRDQLDNGEAPRP